MPKGWGRIGVRVAPSNSNVVYVIGESNDGTLYRSDDRGEHFHLMTKNPVVVGRGLYYSHLTIDPIDGGLINAGAAAAVLLFEVQRQRAFAPR